MNKSQLKQIKQKIKEVVRLSMMPTLKICDYDCYRITDFSDYSEPLLVPFVKYIINTPSLYSRFLDFLIQKSFIDENNLMIYPRNHKLYSGYYTVKEILNNKHIEDYNKYKDKYHTYFGIDIYKNFIFRIDLSVLGVGSKAILVCDVSNFSLFTLANKIMEVVNEKYQSPLFRKIDELNKNYSELLENKRKIEEKNNKLEFDLYYYKMWYNDEKEKNMNLENKNKQLEEQLQKYKKAIEILKEQF
jgi:hypothetical protein